MRRIELIAPFSVARGNLSGKQSLLYPTKNNAAWDSPSNKRNYATNYTARYIGAVRSRDGHAYFAVKKRTAVTMSPAMRQQQALIGGAKVVCDFIMHDGAHIQELQVRYMRSQIYRDGGSFYKYINASVRYSLSTKLAGIFFNGDPGQSAIIYQNPWISTTAPGTPVAVTIPADILAKFWMQLANNPVQFTVNGAIGVAHAGESYGQMIDSNHNVLGLTEVVDQELDSTVVKLGMLFVNAKYDNGTKECTLCAGDMVNTFSDYTLDGKYFVAEVAGDTHS